MNRIHCTAVAFAMSATLLITASPVQARDHAKPRPTPVATGGWVDVALAWLGGVFAVAPHEQKARSSEKAYYLVPFPLPGGGGVPMTGSCIDPNGCVFGGGGGGGV